jgi:hypothetical protein
VAVAPLSEAVTSGGTRMAAINGRPVRAHVAASEVREAADLLAARSQRGPERHAERRGAVVHHRYGGHYGLVTTVPFPAGTKARPAGSGDVGR